MASPERTSPAFLTVLFLLIGAVVVAAALVMLLATRRPSTAIRFEVGQPNGSECPQGTGAPACFRFDVRNMGGGDAFAFCTIEAAPGTQAAFDNDVSSLRVLVPSGQTRIVMAHVSAIGSNSVSAPAVRCS
jgi:hypothetical protein